MGSKLGLSEPTKANNKGASSGKAKAGATTSTTAAKPPRFQPSVVVARAKALLVHVQAKGGNAAIGANGNAKGNARGNAKSRANVQRENDVEDADAAHWEAGSGEEREGEGDSGEEESSGTGGDQDGSGGDGAGTGGDVEKDGATAASRTTTKQQARFDPNVASPPPRQGKLMRR